MSQMNLTMFYRSNYVWSDVTILNSKKIYISIPIIVYKEDDCIVCMNGKPTCGYSRCGHVVYCEDCSIQARQSDMTRCPMCRVTSGMFDLKK